MSESNLTNGNGQAASAHDDFDWSVDKRNVVRYTEQEKAQYDEQYSATLKTIENDQSNKLIRKKKQRRKYKMRYGQKNTLIMQLSILTKS